VIQPPPFVAAPQVAQYSMPVRVDRRRSRVQPQFQQRVLSGTMVNSSLPDNSADSFLKQ
jgi:hypothetical protein